MLGREKVGPEIMWFWCDFLWIWCEVILWFVVNLLWIWCNLWHLLHFWSLVGHQRFPHGRSGTKLTWPHGTTLGLLGLIVCKATFIFSMFFSMCIEQSTCFKWLYPCGKQLHFKSFHQQAAFFFLKGPTPLKINMEPGKWTPLSKPEIPFFVKKKPVTFFQVPARRLFRLVVPDNKGFWFRLVPNNKKTHEELLEAVEFRTHRHVQIFRQLQARRGDKQTWRGCLLWRVDFFLFWKEVNMLRLTQNTI